MILSALTFRFIGRQHTQIEFLSIRLKRSVQDRNDALLRREMLLSSFPHYSFVRYKREPRYRGRIFQEPFFITGQGGNLTVVCERPVTAAVLQTVEKGKLGIRVLLHPSYHFSFSFRFLHIFTRRGRASPTLHTFLFSPYLITFLSLSLRCIFFNQTYLLHVLFVSLLVAFSVHIFACNWHIKT